MQCCKEHWVIKIFTGKKNIGLWGILYLLCYWCCYSFPISVPLSAVPFIFLSPSSFSTSHYLILTLLPMFAHLLHLLYKQTNEKKNVSVPSVSSSLFRWHFPQVTGKQNSDKSELPLDVLQESNLKWPYLGGGQVQWLLQRPLRLLAHVRADRLQSICFFYVSNGNLWFVS